MKRHKEYNKFIDLEKRRNKRKPADLFEVKLASENVNYAGIIENVSKNGMHVIASSKHSVASFIPETIVKLAIKPADGGEADLHCEVRWVHINKTPIHGLTYRMGMELLQQPPECKELFSDK